MSFITDTTKMSEQHMVNLDVSDLDTHQGDVLAVDLSVGYQLLQHNDPGCCWGLFVLEEQSGQQSPSLKLKIFHGTAYLSKF